jgi:small-conductance mechanosensitive channel
MTGAKGMTDLMNQYPEIVAVLFVAAAGVLAFLVRKGLASAIPWVNQLATRLGAKPRSMLSPEFSRWIQITAFWGIVLAGVVLGLSLLGNGELSLWLDRIWIFLARALVALGILAMGHVLGSLTRSLLAGLSRNLELAALSQVTYVVITATFLVIALSHLGLDISFITQLILVLVGVFFAGLALAFALGAKTLVANLAAGGELMHYKPGDHLRIDGIEGTVLEIHRTGAVLSTDEGLVRIPARIFSEMSVTILRKDEDNG